jgi:hypothetical protein
LLGHVRLLPTKISCLHMNASLPKKLP